MCKRYPSDTPPTRGGGACYKQSPGRSAGSGPVLSGAQSNRAGRAGYRYHPSLQPFVLPSDPSSFRRTLRPSVGPSNTQSPFVQFYTCPPFLALSLSSSLPANLRPSVAPSHTQSPSLPVCTCPPYIALSPSYTCDRCGESCPLSQNKNKRRRRERNRKSYTCDRCGESCRLSQNKNKRRHRERNRKVA